MIIDKFNFNYKEVFKCLDVNGIIMFWNPLTSELTFENRILDFITYYKIDNLDVNQFLNLIYIEDFENIRSLFNKDLKDAYDRKEHIIKHYRIKDKDNNILFFIFMGKVIQKSNGYYLIGTHYCFNSVNSKLKLREDNLASDAEYEEKIIKERITSIIECDRITELPNMQYFKDVIVEFLNNCGEKKIQCAMIMLNLDNFKYINESFGHEFGDLSLKEVANKILSIVGEENLVCRYSGDTFIIFNPDIEDLKQVINLCNSLVKDFSKPIIIEKKEIYLTSSIGIAVYPYNGMDFETLLKNSDAAMYVAKSNGKNEYNFFDDSISLELNRMYTIQKGLRTALQHNEMYVVFQPKVTLHDSLVRSFEALVRWRSEEFGFVSPAEFIPIAENTKMIIPIGSFVLEEVFRKIRKLINDGYENFKIAVNLSEMQLRQDVVILDFKRLIKKYKIPPKYIQVEITESMLMKSFDKNVKILEQIKELGISIALDDFGTGYSSLNYLTKLPIDALKIDRSFVTDLENNFKSKCIIENIIKLSHQLGIEVIAEGVEYKHQVEYLESIFCDVVQGYYFSKPESFEKIKYMIGKNIL
ncbi:putative bifunctional diguanylate cyclase/phosphodiesterase [Clostridium uliginosum]|uniref:Diguanylate cyclase (GGDEF) domain-containing protein n=1 Tax=Clostridium uliginosum TaxID=119641 RepID=A0A1I1RR44_9CLOT|nr:EAL domain-containing protein [Clostridium uliginosum]SFD33020.1 diguanylate cyclase (GGDEF) domain-containing protein [Clostridium uliginosum]